MKLRYLLSLSLIMPVASIECSIPSRFMRTFSIPPMVQRAKRASVYTFNTKKTDASWDKARAAFGPVGKTIDSEMGSLRSSLNSLNSQYNTIRRGMVIYTGTLLTAFAAFMAKTTYDFSKCMNEVGKLQQKANEIALNNKYKSS